MARANLLRIDDLLLRGGRVLGLIWLGGMAIWFAMRLESPGDGLANGILLGLLFATAPLGLVYSGFQLRRRERRAWALHRLIDDHVEISAPDLLRDSDFTDETLQRAVRDLNNSGVTFLVWDRKTNLIQDGRLRRSRVKIDECGSCGAKVSVTVRVGDPAAARCPYCHEPVGDDRLMEEKARLIDELDADPTARPPHSGLPDGFSLGIFVVLTLVFWPFGVAYANWRWRASQACD